MRAEARMEVVKHRRVWGWKWGEEPDGIDPSGPDGIYSAGSSILEWSVDTRWKVETLLCPQERRGEGYEKF